MLARFAREGDFDCFLLAGRYSLLDQGALDEFVQTTKDRITRGAARSRPAPMAELPGVPLKDRLGVFAEEPDTGRLRRRSGFFASAVFLSSPVPRFLLILLLRRSVEGPAV